MRRTALDIHPFGGLRAAALSGIDLLPYQLEPALAVFRHGAARVLIADAVGLGKTIQAGLIVRDLAVRHDELRALIVVPAALRDQWRQELLARFDVAAVNADAAWLRSTARTLPPDVNPWSLPGVYVTSFDFLKRAEALRPVEDTIWDAVVVDEAHAAAPGTDRRAAVDAVASRSRVVVLLTATPHSGDAHQFEALCRIGSRSDDTPILMFQRSREDAGRERRRRTVLLPVRLSAAERRMHRLLERYAARVRRSAKARGDTQAALAAVVLRKRALSGATALLLTASRRHALLSGGDDPSERQLPLPLADEDPLEDAPPDDVLAAPGLDDRAAEQRELEAIVRAARRAAALGESKVTLLRRLLRRVREPVIVFTEYRDTLAFIERAVRRERHEPLTLHGGMSPAERAATQSAFNGAGSLLLATDAASEGLNLHRRCRIVVHFELPWTPARVQQRTGRVDRIGQARPVHEILLVASDTAEGLVLAPLVRRSATARDATPESAALFTSMTESRVAAAILDGRTPVESAPPGPAAPASFAAAPAELRAEAEAESARLTRHRDWRMQSASVPAGRHDRGRVISGLRRTRRAWLGDAGAVLVFRMSIHSALLQTVHSELIVVRFALRPGAPDLELLERTARLHLEPRLRSTCDDVAHRYALFVESVRRRERTLASTLPETAPRLVQAGLFDRRSLRDADARSRTDAALSAQLDDRLRHLDACSRLTATLDLAGTLLAGDPAVHAS